MKKSFFLRLSYSFVILYYLISCGGGITISKNQFLGEIPSLEKGYYEKTEAKEKDLKECTDMNKAFKLSKELNLLKDEWNTKIEESVKANPLTTPLPFEGLAGTPYSIKEIVVNKVRKGSLNIKILLKINEDIKNAYGYLEKNLFIYYKAIDKEGKDIPFSTTVAINLSRQELKAGMDWEVYGTWQTRAIINMENFAKVKEVTKEEYDKK